MPYFPLPLTWLLMCTPRGIHLLYLDLRKMTCNGMCIICKIKTLTLILTISFSNLLTYLQGKVYSWHPALLRAACDSLRGGKQTMASLTHMNV